MNVKHINMPHNSGFVLIIIISPPNDHFVTRKMTMLVKKIVTGGYIPLNINQIINLILEKATYTIVVVSITCSLGGIRSRFNLDS